MAALASLVVCTGEDTQCVNTYGSFECVCVPGYRLMDGNCQRKETELFSLLSMGLHDFTQALLEKLLNHLN